jgi:hypothetical protein
MSVSSVNIGNSVAAGQFQNRGQGAGASFRQLLQAIKSGDLNAAQSAYDALTASQDQSGTTSTSDSSSSSSKSNFQQFLQQIGADLSNNDIQGAQQALSSLETQAKGTHHHHHGGGGLGLASSTANSASTTGTGSTTSSILSGVNLTV